MRYTEQPPGRGSLLVLAFLFPVLYLTFIGVRELRSQEALLASISIESMTSGNSAVTAVHGVQVQSLPLYPWLVTLCSGFRTPNELSTRLPAALSVLGMALLAGLTARRLGGPLAGVVAASVVLTNVACLREGGRAGSDTLSAFLITAAWVFWYRLGRERRRWGMAWSVSLACVLAATFAVGIRALVFFYLPLVLLRRPMRGWRRLLLPSHLVVLACLISALGLWLYVAPGQSLFPWRTLILRTVALREGTGGYFRDLVSFPFRCLGYLMPWPFLAWPAFCVAYRPLERRPVLCGYLRTIVASLFVAAWVVPNTSSRVLMPLLAPIAILTGLHYQILVRRYHRQLQMLCRFLLVLASSIAVVGVLVGLAHVAGLVVFAGLGGVTSRATVLLLALIFVASRWLTTTRVALPFWSRLVACIGLFHLALTATTAPLEGWLRDESRQRGQTLSEQLPEQAVVYRTTDWFLVRECFYIGHRVVKTGDPDAELPAGERVVYALAGAKPPILPTREWTPCSDAVNLRLRNNIRLVWRPGGRCILRIEKSPAQLDEKAPPVVVRMYRGERR